MDWLSSVTNERWADIVRHLSLLSAAGFGLLALFTDYKKDGQVTRWGKIAAGGIVLSAVLSIASATFQDRMDAEANARAAEARRQLDARFAEQVRRLDGLNREIAVANANGRRLVGDMTRSLTAQDRLLTAQTALLDNARRSMLLTAGLTAQERRHTRLVLRSLWDEANRIDGRNIELVANTNCRVEGAEAFPTLVAEGAFATVLLLNQGSPDIDATIERSLFAYRHDSVRMAGEVAGVRGVFTRFHSFIGLSPEAIAHPDAWRDSPAHLAFMSPLPADFDSIRWRRREPAYSAGLQQRFPWLGEPAVVDILPCDVAFELVVNGRSLFAANAPLAVRRDEQGNRHLFSLSAPTPANDRNIPRFAGF